LHFEWVILVRNQIIARAKPSQFDLQRKSFLKIKIAAQKKAEKKDKI
jgi:hypothetical protein